MKWFVLWVCLFVFKLSIAGACAAVFCHLDGYPFGLDAVAMFVGSFAIADVAEIKVKEIRRQAMKETT